MEPASRVLLAVRVYFNRIDYILSKTTQKIKSYLLHVEGAFLFLIVPFA